MEKIALPNKLNFFFKSGGVRGIADTLLTHYMLKRIFYELKINTPTQQDFIDLTGEIGAASIGNFLMFSYIMHSVDQDPKTKSLDDIFQTLLYNLCSCLGVFVKNGLIASEMFTVPFAKSKSCIKAYQDYLSQIISNKTQIKDCWILFMDFLKQKNFLYSLVVNSTDQLKIDCAHMSGAITPINGPYISQDKSQNNIYAATDIGNNDPLFFALKSTLSQIKIKKIIIYLNNNTYSYDHVNFMDPSFWYKNYSIANNFTILKARVSLFLAIHYLSPFLKKLNKNFTLYSPGMNAPFSFIITKSIINTEVDSTIDFINTNKIALDAMAKNIVDDLKTI